MAIGDNGRGGVEKEGVGAIVDWIMEWDGYFLEGSGSVENPAKSDGFGCSVEGFAGERDACELGGRTEFATIFKPTAVDHIELFLRIQALEQK